MTLNTMFGVSVWEKTCPLVDDKPLSKGTSTGGHLGSIKENMWDIMIGSHI